MVWWIFKAVSCRFRWAPVGSQGPNYGIWDQSGRFYAWICSWFTARYLE